MQRGKPPAIMHRAKLRHDSVEPGHNATATHFKVRTASLTFCHDVFLWWLFWWLFVMEFRAFPCNPMRRGSRSEVSDREQVTLISARWCARVRRPQSLTRNQTNAHSRADMRCRAAACNRERSFGFCLRHAARSATGSSSGLKSSNHSDKRRVKRPVSLLYHTGDSTIYRLYL